MVPQAGRVYEIHSRNLVVAAYAGSGAFVGIREKFGRRYLFTEWGGEPGRGGSVRSVLSDLGVVPDGIAIQDHMPPYCTACGRPTEFVWDGPDHTGHNYHSDGLSPLEPGGESVLGSNDELFSFLQGIEMSLEGREQ